MNINRIDPAEGIYSVKGTEKVKKSSQSHYVAPIDVSDEARSVAELQRVRDLVLASPNIRASKIEEVKAKMSDPHYFDVAISATADHIIAAFKL